MKKKFGSLNLHTDRPSIIAEAGVNHGCNLRLALKYIKLAKDSGVDAIKFQTYKAEKIVSKISPAYWDTSQEKMKSQYKLFKKFDKFNYKDYRRLFLQCVRKKILFMTTIFDVESVNHYNKFIKVYKISSSDLNNIPLLRKIGSKNKHTIISTGASTIKEIKIAIKELSLPKKKICIMHCVLNYPTKYTNANLNYIKVLKEKFPGYMIGYSDHTPADDDLTVIDVAYKLGAKIVEKHFTHNKKISGNDHYHSADKENFINFFKKIKLKKIILGKYYKNLKQETKSIKYARRSIFAKDFIKKGDRIKENKIITLRPGDGISASKWDKVLKCRARKDIFANKKLNWKDLIQ
jgi:N-acetylneuraminate synthase